MWRFWIPLLLSVAIAAFVCLGQGTIIIFATAGGFLAAFVTLVGSWNCFRASRQRQSGETPGIAVTRRQSHAMLSTGLLVLAGYALLSLAVLGRTRAYAKSAVTAANLRGIGQGLRLYHEDYGDYPPSHYDLIAVNLSTPRQFLSVYDPDVRWESMNSETPYSSFEYQPGDGIWCDESRVVLAFERGPWTPGELRLFPTRGRLVLFADMVVRWLDAPAFDDALRDDTERRRELGWLRRKPGGNGGPPP